ncbi:hypothetical protein MKX03_004097 [Papaver bracteatum]|nr:hypothetical protein MKX03_004097 [Papaver bracteatum]
MPSFKIYNSGVSDLYDYGPPGSNVKSNVLALWRRHFVLEENVLEVDCPCITPEVVLQASGLVDKFTDFMNKWQGRKDAVKLRLGDAVTNGTVNNETLAYFIGRYIYSLHALASVKNVYGFVSILKMRWHIMQQTVGMLRMSAHMAGQSVGIADRSAYDLHAHSERSGIPLVAHEKFSAPKEVEKLVITPVKKDLGLAFKGDQKKIVEALEAMDEKEAMEVKAALELQGEVEFQVCTLGKAVTIKSIMVSISKETKKEYQRVFTPSVIEPSFSIGRIIYRLSEHSFYTRPEDEKLNVFRFLPAVAPIKCTVFPLVQDKKYDAVAKEICQELLDLDRTMKRCKSNKLDTTGTTIGKRYARTDELGVPFAITIRVEIDKGVRVVQDLTDGVRTWAEIQLEYPCIIPYKQKNE